MRRRHPTRQDDGLGRHYGEVKRLPPSKPKGRRYPVPDPVTLLEEMDMTPLDDVRQAVANAETDAARRGYMPPPVRLVFNQETADALKAAGVWDARIMFDV